MRYQFYKLLFFFIFLAFVFACDEVDELTEFEVSESIMETENVDIPIETSEQIPFTVEESFDITSIPEIENNRDFIQSVEINSIEYRFFDFLGNQDAVITEAKFISGNVTLLLDDVNLKSASDNNTIFEITDQEKLSELSNLLDSNTTTINIIFEGILENTPVSFNVEFLINLTAVIDVI